MTDIYIDKPRNIRLSPFAKAHIGPVLQLMNREGWYYYDAKELERYLELNEACFTLLHNGEIVGSIFTTNYGNQAWLGNIIVSGRVGPDREALVYRNKGYAGKMIQHAMQVLGEKGVQTFRLGSVPTAIGAYKKVGFQAEAFTTAQEAFLPIDLDNEASALDEHVTAGEMTPEDLAGDVIRIDETYFKSNRGKLFKALYREAIPKSCLCLKDRGRVVGYIMIRRRTVTREEGGFAQGPDLAYRLGPSCVLPGYGLDGFKILLNKAILPVNAEVEQSGLSAKIYVVFPQNPDRERIYTDFQDLGGSHPEQAFNAHDHIFGSDIIDKNDELWAWMAELGFCQEYFEQTMSVTPGEDPGLAPEKRAARLTMADGLGVFASATPGDKA